MQISAELCAPANPNTHCKLSLVTLIRVSSYNIFVFCQNCAKLHATAAAKRVAMQHVQP